MVKQEGDRRARREEVEQENSREEKEGRTGRKTGDRQKAYRRRVNPPLRKRQTIAHAKPPRAQRKATAGRMQYALRKRRGADTEVGPYDLEFRVRSAGGRICDSRTLLVLIWSPWLERTRALAQAEGPPSEEG